MGFDDNALRLIEAADQHALFALRELVDVGAVDDAATQYPGVYYVYGANAQLGDNGNSNDSVTLTVLAESTTPSAKTCST